MQIKQAKSTVCEDLVQVSEEAVKNSESVNKTSDVTMKEIALLEEEMSDDVETSSA